MDKRKNNGGARPGAGRPSKKEEFKLIEQLDKHIDQDKVLRVLNQMIDEGEYKAVQLYLQYYYGRPKETKDVTIKGDTPMFNLGDVSEE